MFNKKKNKNFRIMKNCLFSQLTGEVHNNNLPVYDGFIIPLIQQTSIYLARCAGYDSSHGVEIYSDDCSLYNVAGIVKYDNPKVFTEEYYGITIKEMGSSPALLISNISELGYFEFQNLDSSSQSQGKTPEDWVLDCSVFKNAVHTKSLAMHNLNIKCKTDDFILMTSLETLRLISSSVNVDVDLVTLVKTWIQNGRSTSGSLSGYFESGCKFNGTPLSSYHTYVNRTLTWESASKIWLPAGNKILCVGYSDADIATKTASGGVWEGKTVVKCD